jgi:hypothetical protein
VKAAIAGWAWRTPLGRTIDEVMARLYAGERAPVADPACPAAAPLRGEPARSRHARFLRRMGLHGLEVAHEALARSGVAGGPRVGLFAGVGGLRAHWDDMMAALADQRDDGERAWERGLRDVHPYWMLRHLSNNVHALASVDLGLRGEGATYGGATGGAQALAAAARALAVFADVKSINAQLIEGLDDVELGQLHRLLVFLGAKADVVAREAAGEVRADRWRGRGARASWSLGRKLPPA